MNTRLLSAKISALNAEKLAISNFGTASWDLTYSQQRTLGKVESAKGIPKDGEHIGDAGFKYKPKWRIPNAID